MNNHQTDLLVGICISLFIIVCCIPAGDVFSQSRKQKGNYIAQIYFVGGGSIKGKIYKVHDTGIEIQKRKQNVMVPADTIWYINVRKKHATTLGVIMGIPCGVAIGAAIAYRITDWDQEIIIWVEGVSLMFLGGAVGAIAGDAIGRIGYHARIRGSLENFESHRESLRRYQLGPDD